MRRTLKYLFGFLGVVVVVAIAAVVLIPRERIVALAADQVRAATGRELALSGDLAPSFWPVLGVRTGPVRLSNAEWGEAPDMVSASAAEIGVELTPLFSGEIKVTTLRLVEPVVALEVAPDGRANWEFETAAGKTGKAGASAAPEAGELPKISLPEAVITDGTFRFSDARSGQRIELTSLDLTAGLESMEAPLNAKGSGVWNGERAEFEAFIDTPAAAIQGNRATARIALRSKPASFGFDGELQAPRDAALPLVNGKLSADVPNPARAIAWATGGAAPAGLGDLGAVRFDGSVSATETALKLAATGSAGYKGRTVGFDLKAEGAEGWLDRQAFTVAASGRAEGLFEASFNGPVSAGDGPAAEGPLKVTISDLRGLAKWAGDAALEAPTGTLESAGLEARLALRGGDRVDFSGMTLRLDRTMMTGEAGVNLRGARTMITARLESGPLDLSPFMAPGGGGAGRGDGGGGAAGEGWSTEPLDLSALRAVDADVAIRAEAVDLGDIEIGRSDIAARLRDGRLDMTINRVDAYGGGISGKLALVAGAETQLSTDLTVSAVQLRPLLNAVAGFDNLEGLGAFRIRLDGRGGSMDALMKSLDGQGALELSDGAILGLNLAAMVRNLTGQGGEVHKTDFTAVTGSFDITDGVLHNTDFSFLGPLIRVIGAGTVDIGRQRQDFRLEPTAVASLTGQGGALDQAGLGIFPVLVTGTWSKPSFKPDLTSAIQGLLKDPDKTIDAVKGLAKGADAGQAAGALLGAVTGTGTGAGSGDSGTASGAGTPAETLGKALGGMIGGKDQPQQQEGAEATPRDSKTEAIGGLLGALLGGKDKRPAEAEAPAPPPAPAPLPAAPAPAADGGLDATGLAPVAMRLPVPAPPNRAELAATPDAGPAEGEPATQQEPTSQQEPAPQQQPQAEREDKLPSFQKPKADKLDAGKILKDLLK